MSNTVLETEEPSDLDLRLHRSLRVQVERWGLGRDFLRKEIEEGADEAFVGGSRSGGKRGRGAR